MKHVWSEFYWILRGETTPTGEFKKHKLLSLADVEKFPYLPKQIYAAIHRKAKREIKKVKQYYPEVKWLVVKHTKYEGEENEEYRWGAGYYFWLEEEPEPPYQLGN